MSSAERTFADTLAKLAIQLTKAIRILAVFLSVLLLGLLVAIVFIIPWLIRVGSLLIFTYGLYEIIVTVNVIYAAFTDTVPLVALYAFVGIVQFSIFFLLAALDLRLVWGAICFSGASMLWIAERGIPAVFAHWQLADLFFHALPPLLFITLVATETLKAARRREGYPAVQFSGALSHAIHNVLNQAESIIVESIMAISVS